MSSPSQPAGSASNGVYLRLRVGLERARRDDIGREHDRERKRVLVPQLLGHLAADEHFVCAAAEIPQHSELVLHLRAAGDEQERPLDVAEQAPEVLELGEQQQAGVRRQELRDPDRRGVRAVSRAERIVDEEVAALRELAGELGVVLRLAGVETGVLEHLDPLVGEEESAGAPAPARSGTRDPRPSAGRGASRPGSWSRRARAAAPGSAGRLGCACRLRPCRSRAERSGPRGRARCLRRAVRRARQLADASAWTARADPAG